MTIKEMAEKRVEAIRNTIFATETKYAELLQERDRINMEVRFNRDEYRALAGQLESAVSFASSK